MRYKIITFSVCALIFGAFMMQSNSHPPNESSAHYTLIKRTELAFPYVPDWPEKFALVGTYDEYDIDDEFAELPTSSNKILVLLRNRTALHALEPEAFRAVLPYFLREGLTDYRSGVLEYVSFYFTSQPDRARTIHDKLTEMTAEQRAVLADCVEFYGKYADGDVLTIVERTKRTVKHIRDFSVGKSKDSG
jgi:hypothetical protein